MTFSMPADFLHRHKDFKALLAIVSEERGILPGLVEKDYWIKHVLYSMTKLELEFELKGGTSLSKAFKIINRFPKTSIFISSLQLHSASMKTQIIKMQRTLLHEKNSSIG